MSILLLGAGKGGAAGVALAPIVITSSATFSVAENLTAVATLTASGGTGSFTWTKVGGADTAKFSLTSGGVLTFTSAPDFETPTDADANNVYLVQVQVDDGVSTPATQSLAVTVTDIVETALDLDFIAMAGVLDPRITFTRTSLATCFGSDGLLKYAANNQVWPSQDFNTTWSKQSGATVTVDAAMAPDSTLTADKLNHVTAGTVAGAGLSSGSVSLTIGVVYILSVYAKAGTKGWLALNTESTATPSEWCYFNLTTGALGDLGSEFTARGIQNVGGGWYRCWGITKVIPGARGLSVRVCEANATVTCTSPGDIYLWGAQTEQITTATAPSDYLPTTTAAVHGPRFDYDPVTHEAKGLLIEASVTNFALRSQELENLGAWQTTNVVVTANQLTAPDGISTADLITTNATSAFVSQVINVTTGVTYNQSCYIKKGSSDWCYIKATSGVSDLPAAFFNLATGVVGVIQSPITKATIQNIGGGWYRCSVTRAATAAGSEVLQIGPCDADGSTATTVGKTIYAWGAQLEVGDTPTSYIPTTSAAVARAADVAVMTGTNFSSWYNQSAGTFVAEFDAAPVGSLGLGIISADNGATSHSIIFIKTGADLVRTDVTTAGGGVFNNVVGTATANINKVGLSFAANDFAACLNGGTVSLDTLGGVPTPTQFRVGFAPGGGTYLNGHVRRIQFWNVAKSDADLQVLTALAIVVTPTAFRSPEDWSNAAALSATGGVGSYIWTKTGGADAARFNLTTDGALSFVTAPDYEAPVDADANNVYLVNVQAADASGTATATISVTVTDVNYAAAFTTVLSASRAGIGSAVVAEDHTGKTRIV